MKEKNIESELLEKDGNVTEYFGMKPSNIDDDDSDDFFKSLEKTIEPNLLDSQVEQVDDKAGLETATSPPVNNDTGNEVEKVDEEKKILEQKLSEYKDLMPVMDDIKSDPNFLQYVKSYYDESAARETKPIKEQLNLPEGFMMDFDEAISDKDSDSARVLNTYVDKMVSSRLSGMEKVRRQEETRKTQLESFQDKHRLEKTEMDKLTNWASGFKPTLDDMYSLFQIQNGQYNKNLENDVNQGLIQRMKQTAIMPSNISGASAQQAPKEMEDIMMDAIIKATDGGLDGFFS